MILQGKRALISGAGSGIGRAVAEELAQLGAEVILAGRRRGPLEEVAGRLPGSRVECVDVSDPAAVEELGRRLEWVDILVNNAGVASSAPLRNLELDEWERLFRINTTGVFLMTRAFLGGMVKSGWGRVVNVASVAGLQGASYISAYSASKHAVLGFTRSLAEEVASKGVTVNALCPGFVDTPMAQQAVDHIVASTGRSQEKALAALREMSPQGRLIEPEEVAYWVACLCHPRARGVNGQALVIDGGGLRY